MNLKTNSDIKITRVNPEDFKSESSLKKAMKKASSKTVKQSVFDKRLEKAQDAERSRHQKSAGDAAKRRAKKK